MTTSRGKSGVPCRAGGSAGEVNKQGPPFRAIGSAGGVKPLSKRQADTLRYILRTLEEEGSIPSFRQIASHLGITAPTVSDHVRALRRKGYLVGEGGRIAVSASVRRGGAFARSSQADERGIPKVGRVAAGAPILAVEHIEGYLDLPDAFRPIEEHFAVKVAGDSMVDAGILDGDWVVVRRTGTADPGAIVLAYLGDAQEATIKVLGRAADGSLRLLPRNAAYRPIDVRGDPFFRIGGPVVGVVRRVG